MKLELTADSTAFKSRFLFHTS